MPARRALVLLTVVAIAMVAWIAFAPQREGGAAVIASSRASAPSERLAPVDELPRVEETVREAPDFERVSAPTISDVPIATEVSNEILLRGFVRPAPGRDSFVTSPVVTATDHFGSQTRSDTKLDGAYAISGLSPGRIWVRAGSIDDGSACAVVDVVAAAIPVQLDLPLVLPIEVMVNVRDHAGNPVRLGGLFELGAIATREAPGEWIELDRDDPDRSLGQFLGRNARDADPASPCIGSLRFEGEPPPFVSLVRFQRVIATQRIASGDRVVEFVVDPLCKAMQPCSMRLRLVDEQTKSPIVGAMVHFNSVGGAFGTSVQDGVFAMSSCPPGWATLRVACKGYESGERRFHVEPGSENDFGDVELGPGQWIAGKVLDESGLGVATDLRYDLLDPVTRDVRDTGTVFISKSGADGAFRVGGMSRGRYRICVMGQNQSWGACAATIDTSDGPVEQVILKVVRGTPLILRTQEPRGVRFKVLDRSGSIVLSNRLRSQDPTKFLLAPGSYDIEVASSGAGSKRSFPLAIGTEPVLFDVP